ncbi:FMN phosphatase YigB (HAD superfamily) [Lysobacter niastensis]|uniref:FMN phosphatase YigB (HAD superfamily) n=1 Tax=Lysobacter niastensis TaxID=380629 RepID=A0ABU1WC80_9GAMM|nr:rhamnan synthesis F family protein [Lysobacter niastensis]MDR7135203.1 FMN phosphatase YigB (HAD superfamily) [Lysobacter niastensis]
MARSLGNVITAARGAIDRHGGGWSGTCAVLRRSYKVFRALGLRGLLRRVGGAAIRTSAPPAPLPDVAFPRPAPIEQVTLKTGVMAHVFYPDLIEEFAEYLQHIPVPFVLMVSVMDQDARDKAEARFSRLSQVSALHIRIVPNRGRDIAPMLVTFRDEILALDLVCHIHTKKSLYTGNEQENWRRYLLQSLLGTPSRVGWIIGLFQAMPELGMVYPESFRSVSLAAHTWLSNAERAREIGDRLGIAINPSEYLDFAAGSMFWARVDGIRPLFELGLTLSSFPEEAGQNDGTLQHAIERMLAQMVRHRKMLLGILPANGDLEPRTEGARNWHAYFDTPVGEQIVARSIDADVVSFDVFDTLVVRPFLTPAGSLAYLEHRVRQRFGVDGFALLRTRAESRARARAGVDVSLATIYATLAELPEAKELDAAALQQMELDLERNQLRARAAISECAARAAREGKRVVAVSDMYLSEATLRDLLPTSVSEAMERIYVSCDTGWRKDTGEAWKQLPANLGEHTGAWLHVGDNEHSDKQIPHDLGFLPPVHVLRPSSLLEVVPALRLLRPTAEQAARWPEQLWLGLLANRFSQLADLAPDAFSDTIRLDEPEMLGYAVFGPLILDYLTWTTRLALEQGAEKILFLSREGYLLHQAFKALQPYIPAAASLEGTYLLASRRAVGTATLRSIDDVDHILGGTFTGSLHQLVSARMGQQIAEAVTVVLGEEAARTEVFLPEMRAAVIGMLRPAASRILGLANIEREAYLAYWSSQVGQSRVILSDVGYAGTIQTHLARLTGLTLSGAYFALNAQAGQTGLHGGQARARFHDQRHQPGESCAVLRYDLLLESILTAPTAQFSHFKADSDGLRPHYVGEGRRSFAHVSRVHKGVEAFIRDVGNVVGSDALHMEFDPALVQQPLHCLGAGQWRAGAWYHDLLVDDHYTGRGAVAIERTAPG